MNLDRKDRNLIKYNYKIITFNYIRRYNKFEYIYNKLVFVFG